MSHFQPYSAYKDSGVEWLGQIPNHWNIIPLKWLFECLDGMRIPLNSEERSDIKGNIPYWGSGGIVDYIETHIFDEPLILLGEDGAPFFERDRPVAYAVEGESWINNHIHVLKPLNQYPLKWFVHVLNSVEYRLYINGSTRDKLTQDNMKTIAVSMPATVEEANSIVASLELEIARIDALVSKKTRFIELLREKWQALITNAVTKGLDPNVMMKDSGVVWLGQVPAHWDVTIAKYVSQTFVPQRNKPDLNDLEDGTSWITMEDMKSEKISTSRLWVADEDALNAGSKVLPQGSVIASCVGSFGVASINTFDVIINQQLQAYIPSKKIDAEYLRYCVSSMGGYFDAIGTSSTIVYVNQQGFDNLPIALPKIIEQKEIVNFLDRETVRIDTLISKTERSIELLKERRCALITAAVTGQIDLREAA